MFLGCFVQFPPISDAPLYTINIKPISSFIKQTQKKNTSKSLWENYVTPNMYVPCVFYGSKTLHDKFLCENAKLKIHEPMNIKYLCKCNLTT
jgi:hypothetical protein